MNKWLKQSTIRHWPFRSSRWWNDDRFGISRLFFHLTFMLLSVLILRNLDIIRTGYKKNPNLTNAYHGHFHMNSTFFSVQTVQKMCVSPYLFIFDFDRNNIHWFSTTFTKALRLISIAKWSLKMTLWFLISFTKTYTFVGMNKEIGLWNAFRRPLSFLVQFSPHWKPTARKNDCLGRNSIFLVNCQV